MVLWLKRLVLLLSYYQYSSYLIWLIIFLQSTYSFKTLKWSPLPLRVVLLVFVTAFGVYICSVCLKQISLPKLPENIPSSPRKYEPHCTLHGILPEEIHYVHLPQPKSFSRLCFSFCFFFGHAYVFMFLCELLILAEESAHAPLSASLFFCPCKDLEVGGLKLCWTVTQTLVQTGRFFQSRKEEVMSQRSSRH